MAAKTSASPPVSQPEDDSQDLQTKPAAPESNEIVDARPSHLTAFQEKKLQTKLDKATAHLREIEDWCAGLDRDVKGYQAKVFSNPINHGILSRVTDYLWGNPKSAIITVVDFKKGMRYSEYPQTQKYQKQLAHYVSEIETKAHTTENESIKQQAEQFHQYAEHVQKRLGYHVDRQNEVSTMIHAAEENNARHLKVFDNDQCPILLILTPTSEQSGTR